MTTETVPPITFAGDRLSVRFTDYDLAAYDLFLRAKRLPEYAIDFDRQENAYTISAPARFAPLLGVQQPPGVDGTTPLPLLPALFDDQAAIVAAALEAKRYACWSDCGLGKSLSGLEFARQVSHLRNGRVLIVTLNEIVPQWIDEAKRFYGDSLPIVRLGSRTEMRAWCAGHTSSEAGGTDGQPCIAVTNYEKFNHKSEADQVVSELRHLAGIVLDEASRLKASGGRQKWALIKSARGIEYKLSLTATPAPNELMEFASQASFLEKLRADGGVRDAAEQIIWTYFTRDPKTHRWTVKTHARSAFFEWMSGWSIYVRDPRRYGWRMTIEQPPEPQYFHHELKATAEQRQFIMDVNADPRNVPERAEGTMFAAQLNAIAANRLSQAAKGFVYENDKRSAQRTAGRGVGAVSRPDAGRNSDEQAVDLGGEVPGGDRAEEPKAKSFAPRNAPKRRVRVIDSPKPKFIADLICSEAKAGHQVLVWTVYDAESAILERLLRAMPKRKRPAFEVLTGVTKEHDRLRILNAFRCGDCRVLISRAAMLGYGMNFQCCTSMIFSGWTFSYESFYQAVRRAYRHGQTQAVRVHVPVIPELEGQMWDAIGRKQKQHEDAVAEMEANYVKARDAIGGSGGKAGAA